MRLSLNLLKQYIEFNKEYTAGELSSIITNLGLEVEAVEDASAKYTNFVIAKIVEAKKHPEANKLTLCKVDAGEGRLLNIVCGAENAREGITVILAKIGAIVPANGMQIKKGAIRGQESEGMLCSASELMLAGFNEEGIVEVAQNVIPGIPLAQFLKADDVIFELSITPNRGDACSILGIVRDLAAKGVGTKKSVFQSNAKAVDKIAAEVEAGFLNINFAECEFNSSTLNLDALECYNKIWGTSGFAPVDLANFVMFLTGAPMHVYDALKIDGTVRVERTKGGEEFVPIKGEKCTLPAGLVVVRDASKVLSLAGVMGDARSAFSEGTQKILVEALHINAEDAIASINATGLKSDSSYRFERGVDYTVQQNAISTLLTLLGCRTFKAFNFKSEAKPVIIEFREEDYEKKVGVKLSLNVIKQILEDLEFKCKEEGSLLKVEVPPFRSDVIIKDDLCEEVLRIQGLQTITSTHISNLMPVVNNILELNIKKVLSEEMAEVISYSFFKDEFFGLFAPACQAIQKLSLKNPITKDLAVMRESLVPNLLMNVAENEKRQHFNLKIFEVGTVFYGPNPKEQKLNIVGLFAGGEEKTFLNEGKNFTIWNAKQKMLEVLHKIWKVLEVGLQFKSMQNNNMHTKQSFEVCLGKNVIGILGAVHPLTLDKFEIKQKVFFFELFASNLPPVKPTKLTFKEDILPNVIRQIAVILPKSVWYEKVHACIKRLKISNLKEVKPLDVFESSERIGEGLKSLSLEFVIEQKETTLTKHQIDEEIIGTITKALEVEFGARLRDGKEAR